MVFIQNSTGYLECIVKSSSASLLNSNITYDWFKEGIQVNLSVLGANYSLVNKKILNFDYLSEVNNGSYVCVASLINGQTITSTEFIVNVVPSNVYILKSKLEYMKLIFTFI